MQYDVKLDTESLLFDNESLCINGYLLWYCFLQRAIKEGADFIETDILSSKDGILICFHDAVLDFTTDIAEHKEFANRKRTYEVQGITSTGYFVGIEAPYIGTHIFF